MLSVLRRPKFLLLCPSDFPGEVSGRGAAERSSPLLWKNRTKRRRASHPGEIYNEQGASEADIDSDSGYCSPKHNQAAGVTQRPADNTAAPTVSTPLTVSLKTCNRNGSFNFYCFFPFFFYYYLYFLTLICVSDSLKRVEFSSHLGRSPRAW